MSVIGEQMGTRWVDHSVDVPLLMSHPKSALLGILQLLKGWETVIEDDITVEQFSGAMTNMVYRCGLLQQGREVQVVLMRVHASSSDLFDRQVEIDTFKGVSRAGLGPQLLLLFRNGRIEEFLSQHVTLAASDIHDPAVSAAIAATLATFHSKMSKVMLPSSKPEGGVVQLWDRLRLWLDLAQQVSSLSELQELGMADLDQEIDALEAQLSGQQPCWVALCHNDLQYGNIMAKVGAGEGATATTTAAAADGAAPASSTPAPNGANSRGSSSSGGGGGNTMTQQLQALGLNPAAAPATTTAAAGGGGGGPAGVSPRQQLLQPATAADGSSSLAPGLSPVKASGPESLTSDDATSLSNVSVAGSAAPSVSGLSVYSSSTATAATTAPSPSLATAPPAGAAAVSDPRVVSLTEASSSSSLQVLGRSPHRTVQLPDGSLVLPGMRARPRGQSPEPARGKRPDAMSAGSITRSIGAASRGSSGQWLSSLQPTDGPAAGGASAAAAAAGGGESALHGSRLGAQQQLQPPSSAAVLRHATSMEGELLLQLMPEDPEAVAEAGLSRRRRISHAGSVSFANNRNDGSSSSSSSSGSASDDDSSTATTSAADSLEAEDLLVPPHLAAARQQQQQDGRAGAAAAGVGRSRVTAGGAVAGDLAAERAAAVSKSARKYREVRRARLQPEEGMEFPTLINSDPEELSGSESDDSSGLTDDDSSHGDTPHRGRSPPSRFNRRSATAAGTAAGPAAASKPEAYTAAAAAAGTCSPVAAAVTAAGADGGVNSSSCITFIDYEYSGFNPVAYDIANHWCEWAADYHTEEPHVLDFNKLPNLQEQQLFVEAYLRALLTKLGLQLPPSHTAAAGVAAADNAAPPSPCSSSGVVAAAGAASPEPPGLGSLAGFKLTSGLNPDSSRKSEAAWSTLSSRGGSVLSFPETDAGWETASQSSVITTKSNRTDAAGMEGEEGGVAAPAGAAAAATADGSSSSSNKKPPPSSQDLCDIWSWLGAVIDLNSNGSNGQLSASAWQQLVQEVVAAAQAYMAASHLLWALWGVIQAKVSDVDFDFAGYGQQRWRMYLQTRPAALLQQTQQQQQQQR